MLSAKKELFTPSGGAYQISRSVRVRSSASAYFNRTFGTPTNGTIWTWSGWVKLGTLSVNRSLFSAFNGSGTAASITLNGSDQLQLESGGGTVATSTAVFRDPSAWYHVVCSVNGSNTTIYVNNNSRLTYSGGNLTAFNTNTVVHNIGRRLSASPDYYFDGYLTEINFIDGQALTPSSFGETNALTGVWQPKRYTGTYGTNGFYLNFSDNSNNTATTIGKDYSGNGNNWTPNNISVTAGVTYDSMLDVPTLYDDGGNGRGNYAVLNAVQDSGALASGNLRFTGLAGSYAGRKSTIAIPSTGKWYWETNVTTQNGAIGNWFIVGMCTGSVALTAYTGAVSGAISYGDRNDGRHMYNETTAVSTNATIDFSTGDVLQCAYDAGTGKFWFGKNNAWWDASVGTTGNPSAGTNQTLTAAAKEWFPYVQMNEANNTADINFGQRPFTYTPPTGFKALNTQNLPTPTISNGASYMDAKLWTGNGTSQTITGFNFQPDFAWIKSRSIGYQHSVYDAVRTTSAGRLATDQTLAETSNGANDPSFTSNGITVRAVLNDNGSGQTFVGWMWNAGGSTVTNTSGTISAQVRANPTAGFSVVTYTGTGANATVGHGLGVAPKMIIVKNRSAVSSWMIAVDYSGFTWSSDYFQFDTGAKYTNGASTIFRQAPTSTVFSVGTNSNINGSTNNLVAYCFSAVAGYSAFGSYTGNGSTDGPFVYLGFRPRWLMIKRSSSASVTYGWQMYDTSRQPVNTASSDPNLWADTSAAEGTGNYTFDLLSNGFKLRSSGVNENASGDTYIYAAFAENPFKLSLAR